MIKVPRNEVRRQPENTIALINVVFLMLIFFLIAGTLAPSPDREVDLVSLSDMEAAGPPDMLFVRSDGTTTWGGEPVSPPEAEARWAQSGEGVSRPFRMAVDRDLPALRLLEVIEELRAAGIKDIILVTRRETP